VWRLSVLVCVPSSARCVKPWSSWYLTSSPSFWPWPMVGRSFTASTLESTPPNGGVLLLGVAYANCNQYLSDSPTFADDFSDSIFIGSC
ncbi:hypothetical protein, partial [Vibrio parahaemolyticus]|uniref:hypothetical protein n=1 Tax=Vibrio parahaemolyticus TaxID=670 RepID=UPI001EEA79B7